MFDAAERGEIVFNGPGMNAAAHGDPMSEASNRATIDALVAAINNRDLAALDRVFSEDVVMEWPQSGERIRGGENRRESTADSLPCPRSLPSR